MEKAYLLRRGTEYLDSLLSLTITLAMLMLSHSSSSSNNSSSSSSQALVPQVVILYLFSVFSISAVLCVMNNLCFLVFVKACIWSIIATYTCMTAAATRIKCCYCYYYWRYRFWYHRLLTLLILMLVVLPLQQCLFTLTQLFQLIVLPLLSLLLQLITTAVASSCGNGSGSGHLSIGQPSGSGLGLSLCLSFVQRMGGHIWANNASTCSTGNPSADGKNSFGGVTETAPPPEGAFRNVRHTLMYTYLHTHICICMYHVHLCSAETLLVIELSHGCMHTYTYMHVCVCLSHAFTAAC
jgi:hypothetical protein